MHIDRQNLALLDSPEQIARQIELFRPDSLRGYGSALAALFAHYQATGAAFHRPKVVTFNSDPLPAPARRLIEEAYGIPVFSSYTAVEAFKIGFACEQGRGYHLNVDLYPLRIVDAAGQDVAPGESGEILISNLVNRATVLLNYRLRDLGTLATAPCLCGRSLPLLASLDGRRSDIITLPSGRIVHPLALAAIFTEDAAVWQFQVVQVGPSCFRVAVVAAQGSDRSALRERLMAGPAERFGEPVAIDIAFVDTIERTPGGKVRAFVAWHGDRETAGNHAVSREPAPEDGVLIAHGNRQ
jgi:phenylacetate-CoA ligase